MKKISVNNGNGMLVENVAVYSDTGMSINLVSFNIVHELNLLPVRSTNIVMCSQNQMRLDIVELFLNSTCNEDGLTSNMKIVCCVDKGMTMEPKSIILGFQDTFNMLHLL